MIICLSPPQVFCVLVSYRSSQSPVISLSYQRVLLFWTAWLTGSPQSLWSGLKTEYLWKQANMHSSCPTDPCTYRPWRTTGGTLTKGSISASLRTNMELYSAKDHTWPSRVSMNPYGTGETKVCALPSGEKQDVCERPTGLFLVWYSCELTLTHGSPFSNIYLCVFVVSNTAN